MKKFINYLKNEDALEKVIGGIFGIVAVIAILIEMNLANFDSAAIAGGIKDIAGTLITVVMLIVAVNALRPKKEEPFSFEGELTSNLNSFVDENSRMLKIKNTDVGNKKYFEIYMESDFNAYFGDKTEMQPGWFLRIPPIKDEIYAKENIKIAFHLNQGTFFGHNKPDNEKEAYEKLGKKIESLILRDLKEETAICQYDKTNRKIEITFKNPLTTPDDINLFVGLIKKVYATYLVLGEA